MMKFLEHIGTFLQENLFNKLQMMMTQQDYDVEPTGVDEKSYHAFLFRNIPYTSQLFKKKLMLNVVTSIDGLESKNP